MKNISSYQKYSTSETVNEKREEANFDIKAFFDAVGEKYEDKGKNPPTAKEVIDAAKDASKNEWNWDKGDEEKATNAILSKDFKPSEIVEKSWPKLGFGTTWEEFSKLSDDDKKARIAAFIAYTKSLPNVQKFIKGGGKIDDEYVKTVLM